MADRPRGLGVAAGWPASGRPHWARYEPIARAALANCAHILAPDLIDFALPPPTGAGGGGSANPVFPPKKCKKRQKLKKGKCVKKRRKKKK